MERGFTTKEQNLYDHLIFLINVALRDFPNSRDKIIHAIDELVEELMTNNEEGWW